MASPTCINPPFLSVQPTTTTETSQMQQQRASSPINHRRHRGIDKRPSPASYYATVFARRRLVSAAFLLPSSCLILPPILLGLYSALSVVTADHAVVASVISALVTSTVMGMIRNYAPNEEEYEYALARCRVRLPLLAVASSATFCRFVLDPLEGEFGVYFPWDLDDIDFWGKPRFVALRISLGMAVLSAAVMFRYTGWFSVVQCSSVPVQSNPFENIFATIRSSPETIIDMVFAPNQRRTVSSAGRSASLLCSSRTQRRFPRYARPTLKRCAAQIAAHAAAGWAFASCTAIPLLVPTGINPDSSLEITVTCVLGSVATVVVTLLADGTSHEIQFRGRSSFASSTMSAGDSVRSVFFRAVDAIRRRGLLPYFASVPVVVHTAAAALFAATSSAEQSSVIGDGHGGRLLGYLILGGLRTVPLLVVATVSVSAYLVLTDVLVRRFLATPYVDVDRLIYDASSPLLEGSGSYPESYGPDAVPFLPEDLIIQLLLRECDRKGLVRSVVAPRAVVTVVPSAFAGIVTNLEEEEVHRNDVAITEVARSLVPLVTDAGVEPEAQYSMLGSTRGVWWGSGGFLEEDLLKVVILETLGGDDEVDGPATATHTVDATDDELRRSLGLTQRHFDTLKRRILVSDRVAKGRNIQQPIIVPLIRALCSYVGGLGEALIRCNGGEATPGVIPDVAHGYPWASGTVSQKPLVGKKQPSWIPGTWSLPPGAAACAEYSILAAARLVALNLLLPATGRTAAVAPARRRSWVSLLIPAVLHSAHRLRCGCLAYAEGLMVRLEDGATRQVREHNTKKGLTKDASTVEGLGVFIATYCPDVRHVLKACDDVALLLLRTLADMDGLGDAEVKVHDECKAWLNHIL